MRGRRVAPAALAALALVPLPAQAGKKPSSPPPLPATYNHPSGRLVVHLPQGWTGTPVAGRPEVVELSDGTSAIRILYSPSEVGYDSLHVTCMAERLTGPMEVSPGVQYEYDFVGGEIGSRRALDSAFLVRYDVAVRGHREWRQRNTTIVGDGQSICVMTHTPLALWKKKGAGLPATVDAILGSMTFN